MNINRDYLIINDVKKSNITLDNGSMFFYITDKNTQNIFVNLVINVSNNDLIQKYANIENAEDYTLTMNIVKPSNTYKVVEGKLHDKENAIFEFNLNEDCCDEIGTYRCELLTKCNINNHEEITTSNKLTYKVKSSVLNDLDDIVEAPQYPLVIQLFDKLSDIEQYEEDRRANELARQLAEKQRQQRFNELDTNMVDRVNAMDSKMDDVEARISAKEQAVDKLIVDTKVDIDEYKVAKDQEIDEYKTTKDTEINNAITNQDNKINTAISNQNDRISNAIATQDNKIDTAINAQNDRIAVVENNDTVQDNRLDTLENKDTIHDSRLDDIEAIDVAQNNRLDAIEVKNQQQDDRLLDIEKVNKRQDMNLKCLFAESKNNMIDVTEEGNSIYLQNSTTGYALIDEIKGNTLVNCNKEPNKELILNGNINTQGYSNVTLTEGVDGGLVDVALEGNTMVNVCDQKDPVAITKSYTVETGNHVALQGEYDGKCRPVVTGNTLWIDNDTEDVLTAFDKTKNLRLQSSFEDKVVTQQMVDNGEELAENLGKYKVDYVISKEDGTIGQTKTFYLNSPLLEGDTIEQQGDNVVHVHRSEIRAYETDDELTLPTDMTNTLVAKATPTYEVISQNDTILCDSYVNGHLDVDSAVPIEKVDFLHFEEELTYLYPSTQYAVQFVSNAVSKVDITLGGAKLLNQDVVLGINKYTITTPSELVDNKLVVSGVGLNIEKVVVTEATDQDFGYFEGMKSVGECEGNKIEILITNGVCNKPDLELGNIYGSNGNLYNSSTTTRTSDFIDVLPNTTYKLSSPKGAIRFYKKDKTYITKPIAISSEFTTPYNCYKLKLIFNTTDTNANYKLIIPGATAETHAENKKQILLNEPLRAVGDVKDKYVLIDGKWYIERNCGVRAYQEGDIDNYITDMINTVYPLETPTYEPIDYNPFTVYSGTTRISNNSTIPCNMTIKNTGYNCLLKPSTTYTVSSNLGLNVVTTPSTLTEDCLRFYDTDTSDVTTMKNVLVLEGDWTTKADLIPSNFSGIESAFEQEYDAEKGKYKVNVKVANEDKSQENNITFYIDEPLRGVENVKDRVYVKDDKVVVQRNCGVREYQDGDFGTYPTDKINTVYPLAEPTYEEVEYNDTKLFIESFKNSTLFYNSNVPVTSKLYYSYSVPIVDTVAKTADVTDQQDSMIIDLATQVAVMEMMLM